MGRRRRTDDRRVNVIAETELDPDGLELEDRLDDDLVDEWLEEDC